MIEFRSICSGVLSYLKESLSLKKSSNSRGAVQIVFGHNEGFGKDVEEVIDFLRGARDRRLQFATVIKYAGLRTRDVAAVVAEVRGTAEGC